MNDREYLDLLNGLEDINVVDAYTEKIITHARALEDLLNDEENKHLGDLDQLNIVDFEKAAIEELDSECPYLYQPVRVTGEVRKAYFDEFNNTFATEKIRLNNQTVTSHGFATLTISEDDEARYVVGHLFLMESLEPRPDGVGLVDFVPRLFAFAPVGSVEIFDEMHTSQNTDRLTKKIPDLIDAVDCAILNAPNESEALRNLKNITISDADDIPKEDLVQLLSYVKGLLDFDAHVPYSVHLQGWAYGAGHEESYMIDYGTEPVGMLVYPDGLQLIGYPTVTNGQVEISNEAHWMVEFTILPPNRSSAEKRSIVIPVANITAMESMRDVVYGNK